MKSDATVQRDVRAELEWDPTITDRGIGATVKDGVVTLRGSVPSYAQKIAAEYAAERIAGVRAVVEEIEVHLPTAVEVSDQALATRAASALDWATTVPPGSVKPKVEKGWVTLEGTVPYGCHRMAAENAIRDLAGLRGLTNKITVEAPSLSPLTVHAEIEAALKRQAELDAAQITVESVDGKVTLSGAVRSWPERRLAERAAWTTPGVTAVDDRLGVIIG